MWRERGYAFSLRHQAKQMQILGWRSNTQELHRGNHEHKWTQTSAKCDANVQSTRETKLRKPLEDLCWCCETHGKRMQKINNLQPLWLAERRK